MKKFITMLLTALLATSLVACNKTNDHIDRYDNTEQGQSKINLAASSETTTSTIINGLPDTRSIYAEVISIYENIFTCYENCPEGVDEQLVVDLYTTAVNWSRHNSGYCFKDINSDGIEELIFLSPDYRLHAILTQVNNEVKFVMMFDRSGFEGFIDENGVIYNNGISKYSSWYESASVLADNGELRHLVYYGFRDNTPEIGGGEYFKKAANGDYVAITQEELKELTKQSVLFENPDTADWKKMLKKSLSYTPFEINPS